MGQYVLRRNDLSLDDDQRAVRDAFASFFENECPSSVVRAAEPLGFDADLWHRLLEMGVAAMSLPAAQGGDDATMVDLALIAEQWGRRLAPVPLASHVCATRLLGHAEAPEHLLGPAMRGERLYTLALAPAAHGVSQLVPDAAIASDVLALVNDRLVAFRSAKPGEHVPNQGCTPLAWWRDDVTSEQVTLASGQAAIAAHELAVAEWKLLTGAALVGLTDAALGLGVEFAKTRQTLGVPIGTLQAVAHPLADTAIEVAGARALALKAAWMMHHEPGNRPELPLMAFDVARRAATSGTATSVHVQGGLGFTVEADVSLYFLRAKGWGAVGGDPAADLTEIGARLLVSAAQT